MYGTPWHGDLRDVATGPVELARLCFIRHAERSSLRPLSPTTAAQLLLARCFAPFWSASGTTAALAVIDDIVAGVPAFDLGVRPTAEVLELVRCAG